MEPTLQTPYALGLDLSLTSTGWAKLTAEGEWETGRIRPPEGTYMGLRLAHIRTELMGLMDPRKGCALVGYEDLAKRPMKQASAAAILGHVHATLHLLVVDADWERPTPINVAVVKKLATGSGSAAKDAVLVEAVKRLGYSGSSKDEADAMWVALALAISRDFPIPVTLPKAHMAAIR